MDLPQIPLTAILLDDDAAEAYLLARVLEDVDGLDVELKHHASTEQAMADLLVQRADLVFLDHHLGEGQTGLDLLCSLRDFGFDGPIVMLTGSSEEGLVANFRRYGADAYICKSDLDPVCLGLAIRVALRLPHKDLPRLVPDERRRGRDAE